MKWRTPLFDCAFDQGARIDRVVAVIAEWISDGIRNDDGSGEMDDRLDAVVADDFCNERLIAALADDQRNALRNRPVKAGREIVEHDHALAGVGKRVHHVTADVAGSAGNQDRHISRPVCLLCRPYTGFDEHGVISGLRVHRARGHRRQRAACGQINLVGRDLDHAAMMAEAADGFVARPAGQFVLRLNRRRQRIERRPMPRAGRPEYSDGGRAQGRRDVQKTGIV